MTVTDFFAGTTKQIEVTITVESNPVDIMLDRVTWIVKVAKSDPDSAAIIDVNADVGSFGVDGIALFDLTPEQTDKAPGRYFYDIVWYTGTDEYMIESGVVGINDRVSDL